MKRDQKRTCEHLSSQLVACPVSKTGEVRGDIKQQQKKNSVRRTPDSADWSERRSSRAVAWP
jgi:hypothetical protein